MSDIIKEYDAVAAVRQIRDRLAAQIAGMTLEEQLKWMAEQDLHDPFLERLRDRMSRRSDEAGGLAERR
jgi:hypothetical protein